MNERSPLVLCEIAVYMTDVDELDGGSMLSTEMEIETRAAADVPPRVALAAVIGGLKAALEASEKQWEEKEGLDSNQIKVFNVEDVTQEGFPNGRA